MKLTEGCGIATQNPKLKANLTIKSGVLLLLFDQSSYSGGLLHLLEGEKNVAVKVKRLFAVVGATKPGIKIIGSTGSAFVALVEKILEELKVPILAESIESQGDIKIVALPAQGGLRYKREKLNVEVVEDKIKVLIVDDTPLIRKILKQVISGDPGLELVGEAGSAKEADELLKTLKPDVLTLDIHMPVEDGVAYLGRLLSHRFIPVVMVTSISMTESEKVFEALALGAIDYIQKPALADLAEVGGQLCEKLKMASKIRENKNSTSVLNRPALVKSVQKKAPANHYKSGVFQRVVAIGASTGGVQALTEILLRLPENIPPIVIVQHIPPVFSRAFCERLDRICGFKVKEAEDGDLLLPNQVLLAPGGLHMQVVNQKNKYLVRIFDSERVNRHKPSVDVLFRSVAQVVGTHAMGLLLTGMGNDGAEGLLEIKNKGGATIAQDEASSVVFGMPGSAIKLSAAQRILPLLEMPKEIVRFSESIRSESYGDKRTS